MDENQRTEETVRVNRDVYPICDKHSFWRTLLHGLLIFLGAFCAFYVVTDWHMKNMARVPYNPYAGKIDRMMKKDMREMDKMFKHDKKLAQKAGNIIHLEQTKDQYKIIIDLRAFDNNENNVQVSTSRNILTINGRSIKKSKNNEQISEFQQSYMFGENVKLDDLTKETTGNYYIVTIPIDDNDLTDD